MENAPKNWFDNVSRETSLADLEREYILAVIKDVEGCRSLAAERLKISPITLRKKIARYSKQGFFIEPASRKKRKPVVDITGQVFGNLRVIERVYINGHLSWRCLCACGRETTAKRSALEDGLKKSCGYNCGLRRQKHQITPL